MHPRRNDCAAVCIPRKTKCGAVRTPNFLCQQGLSTAAVISTEFSPPLSVPLLWPPLGLTPGAIAAPAPPSPWCGAVCIPKKKCGAVCIPPKNELHIVSKSVWALHRPGADSAPQRAACTQGRCPLGHGDSDRKLLRLPSSQPPAPLPLASRG